MIFKLSAVSGLIKVEGLNHRPHRPIEDDDAGAKELFDCLSGVFECFHASSKAFYLNSAAYLPGKCSRSRLFSPQMNSMRSVSGVRIAGSVTVHDFVYALGSSIVMRISM